jgi:phosphoesterase RecJ-like protein
MTADLLAPLLTRYPACLILSHINPEGDAIGSQLALALALEACGLQVALYNRDGVPANCRFLPTWERVLTTLPSPLPPLVIFVDAERLERCALSQAQLPGVDCFVCIDHHTTTSAPIGPALVDTRAAAAGELVYAVIQALGPPITPAIATCLQAALMVDTGRFSYTNTTPTTHRIAAELLAAGADVPTIVEWTWGRQRFESTNLLGRALTGLARTAEGRIVWAVLRQADFTAAGAAGEDTEGIIDHVRQIDGVEVALLFSEKGGEVRVSLRSKGTVDVAALARRFRGGGHVKAAGLTFTGPIDEAVIQVVAAAQDALA